jgi:hypothetical protein
MGRPWNPALVLPPMPMTVEKEMLQHALWFNSTKKFIEINVLKTGSPVNGR